MSEQKKLVIVNSRGFDDERSSVAWSIANTASASNMDVTVFLGKEWREDWAQSREEGPPAREPWDPRGWIGR